MKRKIGFACMVLGVLLVLGATGLLIHNMNEEKNAAEQAEAARQSLLHFLLEERRRTMLDQEMEILAGSKMLTVSVDGARYIGLLDIPALSLSLPVKETWSYPDLRTSPCRYAGSVFDHSLIIAAHNYRQHFGNINLLRQGDAVTFTDVEGFVYQYQVIELETLAGTAVDEMSAGKWDLTLFTCTYGGQSRVAVRCALDVE